MDNRRALESGDTIDIYTIDSELGAGAFGITYKAIDQLGRFVAIKEYCPRFALREASTRRLSAGNHDMQTEYDIGLKKFIKEAKTLASFSHPNIVFVLHFHEANNTAYMIMQFQQGETLADLLDRQGTLDHQTCVHIFVPLMDGLREVHKAELLHFDIKLENIYLRDKSTPCLIDFGGAKKDANAETQRINPGSQVTFGVVTDGYAPPEQYFNDPSRQGSWCDIYAIGASLYQCVTGKIPINSPLRGDAIHNGEADPLIPAADLVTGCPVDFTDLIHDCLNIARTQRPQQVREVQDRLMGQLANKPLAEKSAVLPPLVIEKKTDEITATANTTQIIDKLLNFVRVKTIVWLLVVGGLMLAGFVFNKQANKKQKLAVLKIKTDEIKRLADLKEQADEIKRLADLKEQADEIKRLADLKEASYQTQALKTGYLKISAQGKPLSHNASQWQCVKDVKTGFMWEVKATSGFRKAGKTYTWYRRDDENNGGNRGIKASDSCHQGVCNTQAYVDKLKKNGLCGYTDWILPNKIQLQTLVDYLRNNPAINTEYFPNTAGGKFWSASSYAADSERAWFVYFNDGNDDNFPKSNENQVRLVRGGQ